MATKRPHFVPRAYLRAWANSHDQVAYRRRDGNGTIPNSITNVAVAGGIYGVGELGEAREKHYQQVEGEWPDLRRELATDGDLRGDRRSLFALFAALQLVRTLKKAEQMNFIPSVAATTTERPIPRDAVRDYLRHLVGADLDEAEVEAAWTYVCGAPGIPTPDLTHSVAVDVAIKEIAPRLQAMNWTVHKFRGPVLISNDSPVHSWRRPTTELQRGDPGIETADEVRFPLTPSALLVMDRGLRRPTPQWSQRNPRALNTEIARQSHQFIFGTPQSRAGMDRLALSNRAPRLRFSLGPGYTTGPSGNDEYIGDVLRMYVE